MAKRKTQQGISLSSSIEHDAPSLPGSFTAWHYFLARALAKTRAPGFGIDCFVKLGSLPLEADVIILHLDKNADIQEFAKYFDFLVPSLRRCVILEYKSPDDRLTLSDFDTVRAYAMLAKRNYDVVRDDDVAVVMMYSHVEGNFFDGCAQSGFPFVPSRPGVLESCKLPLSFYAVDLVELGKQHPDHPINLLSARRRTYGQDGFPSSLGPFGVLYETVFFEELKKMGQTHVPGTKELLDDAGRTKDLILSQMSPEEIMRRFHLRPEDLLRRLSPEDLLRHLSPEDLLRHLSPEQRLSGLAPEDRLRGLSVAERARLRELLLKQEDR